MSEKRDTKCKDFGILPTSDLRYIITQFSWLRMVLYYLEIIKANKMWIRKVYNFLALAIKCLATRYHLNHVLVNQLPSN